MTIPPPLTNEKRFVVASAYGAAGASTRVRALDWLDFLQLPAEVESYLGLANVRPRTMARHPIGVARAQLRLGRLKREKSPDRLFITRSAGPFTRGYLESDLLRRSEWGVYDFDDALWADARSGIHRVFDRPAAWARTVRAADQVVAGNQYLAEAAASLNQNVTVIPSCVNPSDYPEKQSYAMVAPPKVVWMGSPATEAYLGLVAPALAEVHRITGARLTLISSGERPLGQLDAFTDRVRWNGQHSYALLAESDCGIMPLPDTPFTRGKCAYKLLQYGAAGLPVVASPVGINTEVIQQLGGLPPATPDDWVDALLEVLQEPAEARSQRGHQARRIVQENYSFAAWSEAFLRAVHLPERRPASKG